MGVFVSVIAVVLVVCDACACVSRKRVFVCYSCRLQYLYRSGPFDQKSCGSAIALVLESS